MSNNRTNKLTCVITGRKLIATKEYYERKVEKAGGEEQLHTTYICREAKNLLKQGSSVEKIREVLDVDASLVQEVPQQVIDRVIKDVTTRRARRINNIVNISSMMNTTSDPEVKQYIKNLKNAK